MSVSTNSTRRLVRKRGFVSDSMRLRQFFGLTHSVERMHPSVSRLDQRSCNLEQVDRSLTVAENCSEAPVGRASLGHSEVTGKRRSGLQSQYGPQVDMTQHVVIDQHPPERFLGF